MNDVRADLRQIIKEQKYSIQRLAELSGIAKRETISSFLNGKHSMSFDKVDDLLYFLGYELTIVKRKDK